MGKRGGKHYGKGPRAGEKGTERGRFRPPPPCPPLQKLTPIANITTLILDFN